MKHNVLLTITSLLSILFMTLHLTSDTVHARVGTAEAGAQPSLRCPSWSSGLAHSPVRGSPFPAKTAGLLFLVAVRAGL